MPTNKNASIRYQALDKCFRDRHHRYYMNDLIKKCEAALFQYNGVGGVSRRQLFEDIRYMESEAGWNIPLERIKDGRKIYYRYEDPDFTINEQPLTDDEAGQLETAIITLSRFRGMPSNEWIDEVISNLEWRFHLKRSSHNIIGFDHNTRLKGLQYLSPLIESTLHQEVLRIRYKSYKEMATEQTYTLHPYYVKQYNNRWFLLAKDNDSSYIINLALDRIYSIEIVDDIPYIPNADINFDTYFDDVIGVTLPCRDIVKEHIELQLSQHQYAYVASKPLHPSQQTVDEAKHIISIDVRPNYELDYHILSLGPDVTVLSPQWYRDHIREKLEECLEKYT